MSITKRLLGFWAALTALELLCLYISPTPVSAQNNRQQSASVTSTGTQVMPQGKKKLAPKTQAQVEMENYYQKLSKPVSLPDVPDIGGHSVFRFGLENSDKSGMTNIGQRYGTSSTPQQVLDFYKQSLLTQKWKLNMVSQSSVRAEKGDKNLTINIMPKGSPEVATDFMINYSYKSR